MTAEYFLVGGKLTAVVGQLTVLQNFLCFRSTAGLRESHKFCRSVLAVEWTKARVAMRNIVPLAPQLDPASRLKTQRELLTSCAVTSNVDETCVPYSALCRGSSLQHRKIGSALRQGF